MKRHSVTLASFPTHEPHKRKKIGWGWIKRENRPRRVAIAIEVLRIAIDQRGGGTIKIELQQRAFDLNQAFSAIFADRFIQVAVAPTQYGHLLADRANISEFRKKRIKGHGSKCWHCRFHLGRRCSRVRRMDPLQGVERTPGNLEGRFGQRLKGRR